jgi:hypothetical protein
MRVEGGGELRVSANEYSSAHGAQINSIFLTLTPYLTNDLNCYHQRIAKRGRIFGLTNSALVYERWIRETDTKFRGFGLPMIVYGSTH